MDQADEGPPAFIIPLVAPGAGDPASKKESPILSVQNNEAGSLGTETGGFFAGGIVQ
jgi:hypothetical protein